MLTKYQNSLEILKHRVSEFGKSVKTCNMTKMLDDNTLFMETLKHVNNAFMTLSQEEKDVEHKRFNSPKYVVDRYFEIKGAINNNCICQLANHK